MAKKLRVEIRETMRKVLANLDRRWVQAASAELCEQLGILIHEEIHPSPRHVLAWTAHFPGEIDLSPFISSQLGERAVYLPRALPDRSMTFVSIDADWISHSEEGLLGIPQPLERSGTVYSPEWAADTVVIVPGLAFDRQGNRLGRGGGYYDRFLANPAMFDATLVGVGWSLQLVPRIPSEPHDVPVNWVCNERDYFAAGTLLEKGS